MNLLEIPIFFLYFIWLTLRSNLGYPVYSTDLKKIFLNVCIVNEV